MIDLHCDLLEFLLRKGIKELCNPESRCSLDFLSTGKVFLQVLAAFSYTKRGSVDLFNKQVDLFLQLQDKSNGLLNNCITEDRLLELDSKAVNIIMAIENASGLCETDDKLDVCFDNLDNLLSKVGRLAYIGIVWNGENRFGGGIGVDKKLTSDGEELLAVMSDRNVPLDLSHCSDNLIESIYECVEKKNLHLEIIASHTNFRDVFNAPRNITREFAVELLRRDGIIGINFMKKFLGDTTFQDSFFNHINYAKDLNSDLSKICIGSDFFDTGYFNLGCKQSKKDEDSYFFTGFGDSSCLFKVSNLLEEKLSRQNFLNVKRLSALRFLERAFGDIVIK